MKTDRKEAYDTDDSWPYLEIFVRSKVQVSRPINAVTESQPYLWKRKAYKLQTWYTGGVRWSTSPCRCAGKTVKSIENTCHTWALLRWWFNTKRRYNKCMHLYLYLYRCAQWLSSWKLWVAVQVITCRRRVHVVVCNIDTQLDYASAPIGRRH